MRQLQLSVVDPEKHPLKALLDDAAGVIGYLPAGICDHLCLCVLHHHHSVAVVNVGDGVCLWTEVVEEQLLASEILGESLVIVEMVVSEVGEYSHLELQTCYPFLLHAYRTDFHKAVSAACLHHLVEKRIDGQRV